MAKVLQIKLLNVVGMINDWVKLCMSRQAQWIGLTKEKDRIMRPSLYTIMKMAVTPLEESTREKSSKLVR
ncbi:hypothetical protein MT997_02655 [Paenibacillus sp. OVF10]|nr:hypothetical protein MT997_02655 [Paenibacillus sp. OVF10]